MARRGKGEGSIYQRKDGRWVGSLLLENGKRKYLYGKTRREVQEKLRIATNEQKQGILATGPQQKLASYLIEWLETVQKPAVRATTYVQYRSAIKKHLIPAIGHISLQKLTAQRVQALYAQKLDEGLSPRSVGIIHAVLHSSLENAVKWNLVSRNVTSMVSVPRTTSHEVTALNSEQAQKLLEASRGHHLEALVLLAITTGMRRGELLALRWSDIDFENSILFVKRSVNRIPSQGYVENDPKTRTSKRKIMLPNVAKDVLKEHRERQGLVRVKTGEKWRDMDLVFCNHLGGYLHTSHVLTAFHKLVEDAGLPPIRFHDLRHSAATILLVKGVHPKVVQELLGHSSIVMTMDTYSHVLPSMQREAMNTMDEVFKRQ